MTLPKIEYRLKEVVAWSVGSDCEHRYVDVVTHLYDKQRTQTLELPSTEALHLCASMGNTSVLSALVEPTTTAVYHPAAGCALPGMVQLLAQAIAQNVLDAESSPVQVLVDINPGTFSFTNAEGDDVVAMLLAPTESAAPDEAHLTEWAQYTTTELEHFLASANHNSWLSLGPMRVYCRKGHHIIQANAVDCFDIASVEVARGQRGRGHFLRFITTLTEVLKKHKSIQSIYVENVLNPRLERFLLRHGFSVSNPPGIRAPVPNSLSLHV